MKKTVFFSLAALVATMQLNAQKKIKFDQPQTLNSSISKKTKLQKKARLPQNEARIIKSVFTHTDGTVSTKANSKTGIVPDNLLVTQSWGELKDVDNNEFQLFQMDTNYAGENISTTIKFLDEESITPTSEFTLELPSTTNYTAVLADISKGIGESSELRKFMVYVHFFEGGMGPEYQKDEVWIVDETGNVISKIDGAAAFITTNASGEKQLISYNAKDSGATIQVLDKLFNIQKSLEIPEEYLNYYLGDPLKFVKVNGQDKIVISHYEKLFMDNDTFEVTPDNHLMLNLYDMDLNLENTYAMDISSKFPDNPMVLPQVKFGTFLFNGKYDVSDKIFNESDDLEFFYQIEYYDLMRDKTWTYNYVGNEEGQRILAYEEPISDAIGLQTIDGENDEAGFLLTTLDSGDGDGDGDGDKKDEGSGASLQMFSMESWTAGMNFPAVYNGQQISAYFNRIPSASGYSYLIGLGEGMQENGTAYGIVNQYSKTGELEKAINLNIGQDPYLFIPLLGEDYLDPKTFNTDSDYEFSYIHKHNDGTGTLFNEFSIAKDHQEPIFTKAGNENTGDLIGSGFVFNKTGNKFIKLALVHDAGSDGNSLTEFYNIPFASLATQNAQLSSINVYTDNLNHLVGWTEKATAFEIYDTTGRIVKKGFNANQTSTANLPKGMYIVKLQTTKGSLSKKFIVK